MSAEVCRLAARVIGDEAEFIQAAVGVVRSFRRRPQPSRVVEPFGHWHRLPTGAGPREIILGDERDNSLQLTDPAVADQFAAATDGLIRTMMGASLQNPFVLSHRFDHRFTIINSQREWLLAVNVLS